MPVYFARTCSMQLPVPQPQVAIYWSHGYRTNNPTPKPDKVGVEDWLGLPTTGTLLEDYPKCRGAYTGM